MTEIRDAVPEPEPRSGVLTSMAALAAGVVAMTRLVFTSTFRLLGEKLFPTPLRGRSSS